MRTCPVCTSGSSDKIFVLAFVLPENFPLNDFQEIRHCQSCGMVFSDSSNNQKDFDRYYSRSSKYTGSLEPSPLEKKRFTETTQAIAKFSTPDSSICDLGCGGGGILRHLSEAGFKNLTGIDGGDLKQDKFRFIRSDLFSFSEAIKEPFDLLLCTGVLEHVLDLDLLLKSIHSTLKSDGYLYVEVPDASRYAAYITSPYQDFNIEHINHFSEKALRNLLQRMKFEIISTESFLQQESDVHQMPVIRVIARKSNETSALVKEENLLKQINQYIERSEKIMMTYAMILTEELKGKTDVYIWGTGQLTLKLLGLNLFKKIKVAGLIDRNSTFDSILGVRVEKPTSSLSPDIPIIIGSTLHATSIRRDIESLGLRNSVIELPVKLIKE